MKISLYSYIFTSAVFLGYVKFLSLALTISLLVGLGLRESCDYLFSLDDDSTCGPHTLPVILRASGSAVLRSILLVPLILWLSDYCLGIFQSVGVAYKVVLSCVIVLYALSNLLSPLVSSHSRSPQGSLIAQPAFSIARTLVPIIFFIPLLAFKRLTTMPIVMAVLGIEAACTILIFVFYFRTQIFAYLENLGSPDYSFLFLFRGGLPSNGELNFNSRSKFLLGLASIFQAMPGYFDKYITASFSTNSFALSYVSLSLLASVPVVFFNIRAQPLMSIQSRISGIINSPSPFDQRATLTSLRLRERLEIRKTILYMMFVLFSLVAISRTGLLNLVIKSSSDVNALYLLLLAGSFLLQAYACVVEYQFVLYQRPGIAFSYSFVFALFIIAAYWWASARVSLGFLSLSIFLISLLQSIVGGILARKVTHETNLLYMS